MSLYKIDMHVRTRNSSSSGEITIEKLVHLYKIAGYSGIVVADQFSKDYFDSLNGLSWKQKVDCFLRGYQQALEVGKRWGLNVFPGMEIRFTGSDNDYLVYGADENLLKENPDLFDLGLYQFRKLIQHSDVLIYQAHPFRPGTTAIDRFLIDGFEVFNGDSEQNSRNHLAYAYAKENHLRMISSSDFHRVHDLGKGGIIVSDKIATSEELVSILKRNRVVKIIENFVAFRGQPSQPWTQRDLTASGKNFQTEGSTILSACI